MLLPVVAGRLVTLDEGLLFFQHTGTEPGLFVDVDDPRLEQWCFTVLRVCRGEQAVDISRITIAFL